MTLHTKLSYFKSLIRLLGFGFLAGNALIAAGITLAIAELLGVIEEFPGTYAGTTVDEGNVRKVWSPDPAPAPGSISATL